MSNGFSRSQVAKFLNVSERAVARWMDAGRLPGITIPGSQGRRIPGDQLIRFLREHHLPVTPALAEALGIEAGDPLGGLPATDGGQTTPGDEGPIVDTAAGPPAGWKTQPHFTTSEVARICQVSTRTVNHWFDSERLQGFRGPNRVRRVPRELLLRFLREHGMPLFDLE